MVVRVLWEHKGRVRFSALRQEKDYMYDVYILKSLKDFRTYTGYAKDAESRLKEHNSGKVNATKNRRPLKILYTEKALTLAVAKKRELYWKSGVGRRKLKQYFKTGFPPRS